jgi:hypothetical protein
LLERYGDNIFFAEISGRKNVICFRDMAARIINDKWYCERSENVGDESVRIVAAAAKLVQAQIREYVYNTKEYPITSDFCDVGAAKKWLPSLLLTFMETIIKNELKMVSISHSIVQAARPRSAISPILFGVGVSLDHLFGSRQLLDMLARLGFSVTHDEVGIYKQSVVQSDNSNAPESYPSSFTQWSGDNIDHNIKTLDGAGTFHGMGIISMTTPCSRLEAGGFINTPIQRLKRCPAASLVRNRGITLLHYPSPEKVSLSTLCFKPMEGLHKAYVKPPSTQLDLLWHVGWHCTDEENPRPSWAGFMHDVCKPMLSMCKQGGGRISTTIRYQNASNYRCESK